MVIRTKSRTTSIKTPVGICILAGAATGMLVAIIATVSTPAVQADAELARPAVAAPSGPVASFIPAHQPIALPLAKKAAPEATGKKQLGIIHGLASWYGGVFNGRKTASGEKFNMHELTACHPSLPFGSLVRVINRSNRRSVIVRINDRGDLVDARRVIDLSWAAAEKLAMTQSGLAKVDVEVISLGGSHTVN